MKTILVVQETLASKESELKSKEKEYKGLSQIACLDTTGRKLDEEISQLKGEIKALKWVLS